MNIENIPKVDNNMNTTNLRSFKIEGLFGRYDVSVFFDKEVNIFIGENGLGKTTVLNCLYYVLQKKYSQLEKIPFEVIELSFKNLSTPLKISKADVIAYNQNRTGRRRIHDQEYLEALLAEIQINPEDLERISPNEFEYIAHHYADMQGIPSYIARKRLAHILNNYEGYKNRRVNGDEKKVRMLNKTISENLSERIIYLPTYRRIENDFSNLNLRNEEINDSEMLIRFGMSDVQKNIESILNQIRTLAVEGFNEMTGILLEQYTEDSNMNQENEPLNLDIVTIVLDRLGDKINLGTKRDIIELIRNGSIYEKGNLHLLNLLRKLIATYDQQKYYDDRINGFVRTCNRYLNDKHFRYDPSNLTLKIHMEHAILEHEDPVKLTQLSSGEKQIVSLFSKLYLESDDKSIVIIDEPELSLSIRWQQMLLPDIMRSQNCNLLLTVTHSPFIFENEFDLDAREIRGVMARR